MGPEGDSGPGGKSGVTGRQIFLQALQELDCIPGHWTEAAFPIRDGRLGYSHGLSGLVLGGEEFAPAFEELEGGHLSSLNMRVKSSALTRSISAK